MVPLSAVRAISVSAAGLLLILGACSPLTVLNAAIPKDGYVAHDGIAYGPEARQKLDVYTPVDGTRPASVVVFLYGGSWKRGDRANYRFIAEALTSRGHVTVIPDYRVYPDVRFPAFVEDSAVAVGWVREHIGAFGGDPDRIFLMGHSAGAHIAALLTLDERYLADVDVPGTAVRGMIGLAGPYAFDPLQYRSTRPVFVDTPDPDMARPITFVDGQKQPFLLLHGGDDTTVYPANSKELASRIRAAGGSARNLEYANLGHIGIVLALAKPFRGRAPVLEDASAFIDSH